jgi:hypothetical protein
VEKGLKSEPKSEIFVRAFCGEFVPYTKTYSTEVAGDLVGSTCRKKKQRRKAASLALLCGVGVLGQPWVT